MLRPFVHPVACCWMLLSVVAQSLKPVKLFSQQLPTLPTMLGPRTLIMHGLQRLMGCILPTMYCRSQHCWELLHPFAQPYPAAYTFLSFEIAEVCLSLANWRLYKRHYLIINDWVAKTFQQRPGSSKFACIKFIIQFTHKLKPSFYGVSKFLFTDHCKTTHSRRQHAKST